MNRLDRKSYLLAAIYNDHNYCSASKKNDLNLSNFANKVSPKKRIIRPNTYSVVNRINTLQLNKNNDKIFNDELNCDQSSFRGREISHPHNLAELVENGNDKRFDANNQECIEPYGDERIVDNDRAMATDHKKQIQIEASRRYRRQLIGYSQQQEASLKTEEEQKIHLENLVSSLKNMIKSVLVNFHDKNRDSTVSIKPILELNKLDHCLGEYNRFEKVNAILKAMGVGGNCGDNNISEAQTEDFEINRFQELFCDSSIDTHIEPKPPDDK